MQCQKQLAFQQKNKVASIRSPNILHAYNNEDRFSFEMEFFNAHNFVQAFDRNEKAHLDYFVRKMIELLEQFEQSCEIKVVDFDVIEKKFQNTLTRIAPSEHAWLNSIFHRFRKEPLLLPVGVCHGDLTLSNILFYEHELILIDFLDTFLETPLQDMVKLRQDTLIHWSLEMVQEPFDNVKIKMVMRYLDEKLVDYFKTKRYYRDYYDLFQFMNIVRILPYCHDEKLIRFLKTELNSQYA